MSRIGADEMLKKIQLALVNSLAVANDHRKMELCAALDHVEAARNALNGNITDCLRLPFRITINTSQGPVTYRRDKRARQIPTGVPVLREHK